MFAKNDGVVVADTNPGAPISNGVRAITARRTYRHGDAGAPEWVRAIDVRSLAGTQGPVTDPARLAFFDLGAEHQGSFSSEIQGWAEFDARGLPVNEGIVKGTWDFMWVPTGAPDWSAPAQLNPHVPNALALLSKA